MDKLKKMDDSTKRKLMIVLAVVCIALIITFYFVYNRGVDYSRIKEDSKKKIVYTISSKTDDEVFIKEIPHLNLNFDFIKDVNNDIDSFINTLIDTEHATISYNYDINGDVLSYVVKMIDYSYEYGPKIYFKGYNINLKDKTILQDQELLDLYGYSYSDVEKSIYNKFNEYYKEMLKEGYYDQEECDYECFISGYREVDNYLEDIVFYIKGGELYAYKPFKFYSITGDEEYFKEKHFMFLITKQ